MTKNLYKLMKIIIIIINYKIQVNKIINKFYKNRNLKYLIKKKQQQKMKKNSIKRKFS